MIKFSISISIDTTFFPLNLINFVFVFLFLVHIIPPLQKNTKFVAKNTNMLYVYLINILYEISIVIIYYIRKFDVLFNPLFPLSKNMPLHPFRDISCLNNALSNQVIFSNDIIT